MNLLTLVVGGVVVFVVLSLFRRNRKRTVLGLRAEDGDSLIVRDEANGEILRIRLAWIDAPERGSPGAEEARDCLNELARNKVLILTPLRTDQYDRTVGRLSSTECPDLNLQMIRSGHAWHYVHSRSKQPVFLRIRYGWAQTKARFGRQGLWARWGRTPPWKTRKKQRSSRW